MDDDILDLNKLNEFLLSEGKNTKYDLQQELDEFLNLDDSNNENSNDAVVYPDDDVKADDCESLEELSLPPLTLDSIKLFSNINQIKPYLSGEELEIINSCTDLKLRNLMVLNRSKHIQLKNLQMRYSNLHVECARKLNEINKGMVGKQVVSKLKSIIVTRLGYPYFKSADDYTSGQNSDSIKKKKNGEIWVDYLERITNWTCADIIELKCAICLSYYKYEVSELQNKLSSLKRTLRSGKTLEESSKMITEIENLQMVINRKKLETEYGPPPINTNAGIDWLKISTIDLKRRHTDLACTAIWNFYLHPSVNKGPWTDAEDTKILALCEKYDYQNWEEIAKELNTNRSAFSTCVHYHSHIYEKFLNSRFTAEEDEKLCQLVKQCQIGNYIPWNLITRNFKHRSKLQLHARYTSYLSLERDINKGRFSMGEDILLYSLIKKHGENYKKCQEAFKNRNMNQLRTRYQNYIKHDEIQLGNWTLEEDRLILQHLKDDFCRPVSILTKSIKRSGCSIRQRAAVLMKWTAMNPDTPLEEMRRRTHSYKSNFDYFSTIQASSEDFLKSGQDLILENVNKMLPNGAKTRGRPAKPKSMLDIDASLVAYFKGSVKIGNCSKDIPELVISETATSIVSLLELLNARLEIPDKHVLERHQDIDIIDLNILESMRKNLEPHHLPSRINKLIPPNLYTLIGLRAMLMNHKLFKEKYSNQERFLNSFKMSEVDFDETSSENVRKQLQNFKNRFVSLFKWPCIMSIIEPNETLGTNIIQTNPVKKIMKRGRPKKDLTKVYRMVKAKAIKNAEKKKVAETLDASDQLNINGKRTMLETNTLACKKRKSSKNVINIAEDAEDNKSQENAIDSNTSTDSVVKEAEDNNSAIIQEGDIQFNAFISKDLNVTSELIPNVVNIIEGENETSKSILKPDENSIEIKQEEKVAGKCYKNEKDMIEEEGNSQVGQKPEETLYTLPYFKQVGSIVNHGDNSVNSSSGVVERYDSRNANKMCLRTYKKVKLRKDPNACEPEARKKPAVIKKDEKLEAVILERAWTYEEDKLLILLIEEHGFKSAQYLRSSINRKKDDINSRCSSYKNWSAEISKRHIDEMARINHASLPHLESPEDENLTLEDQKLIKFFKSPLWNYNVPDDVLVKQADVVQQILGMLGAKLDLSAAKDNPNLDEIDRRILRVIDDKQPLLSFEYVPPNLQTITALQLMLTNSIQYLKTYDRTDRFRGSLWFDEVVTKPNNAPLSLFKKRFDLLFRWPCITSMQPPSNQVSVRTQLYDKLMVDKCAPFTAYDQDYSLRRHKRRTDKTDKFNAKASLKQINLENSVSQLNIMEELKDIDLLDSILNSAKADSCSASLSSLI